MCVRKNVEDPILKTNCFNPKRGPHSLPWNGPFNPHLMAASLRVGGKRDWKEVMLTQTKARAC
jgi:hypothetical protein